jgi:hypothetical protein
VGDLLTMPDGVDWAVTKSVDDLSFAEFSTQGGKLRQVFP